MSHLLNHLPSILGAHLVSVLYRYKAHRIVLFHQSLGTLSITHASHHLSIAHNNSLVYFLCEIACLETIVCAYWALRYSQLESLSDFLKLERVLSRE